MHDQLTCFFVASSSRQRQEHERTFYIIFGYLNDCWLKNIDETVPHLSQCFLFIFKELVNLVLPFHFV